MSRHRDIRSINYKDEYDGFDDIYGHSMEDDYCVSPSAQQFLFDRSKQQNIASFIKEPDIVEDNEDMEVSALPVKKEHDLSELERAKLTSCMESIRNIIGDSIDESKLQEMIIVSGFDAEVALDAILKESSPTNIIDPAINKERLGPSYPGVSIDKPKTSTFIIPKISFNKEQNASTSTISHSNNTDSLKNSMHSSASFSSLTRLIANHMQSANSDETKQHNTNAQPFSSLAALTAHHLQKCNTSNNVECHGKEQPLTSQFVIPKLSVKENSSETGNIQLYKSFDSENKKESTFANSLTFANSRRHSCDLLEKDLSDLSILPKNDIVIDEKQAQDTINITRVPSPEDLVIDLTIALKETKLSKNSASSNIYSITPKKFHDISNLEIYLEDKNNIMADTLPVTLNLCALRHVKLPCTKRKASMFGRTLCKKWKIKKPILKVHVQHYGTIKPFDFSVPYRHTN